MIQERAAEHTCATALGVAMLALLVLTVPSFLACGDEGHERSKEENTMDIETLRTAVLEKSDEAVIQAEKIGPSAASMLIELLESPDAEVRDLALCCLVLTGYDKTAAVLVDRLDDDDSQVRTRALQSLRSRYDSSVLPGMIKNLANPDPIVRSGVARMIGETGDTSAMKPLYGKLAEETDTEVKEQLKLSLAKLGDERLEDEFASRLDAPGMGGRYRTIRDLEYIGDKRLAKRLMPALSDTGKAYEIGHPEEEPRFARVCDAAVNLIARWFDNPFSFTVDEFRVYSDEEIAEAERFLGTLE